MEHQPTRWRQRPVLAAVVDVALFLAPVAAASLPLWLLAPHLSGLPMLGRIAVLLACSIAAAVVAERLCRRLLPVSALLRLTLVFPDRAPTRFSVAREAGNPKALVHRLSSQNLDEATAAGSILALVGSLAAHDRRTRGHSERVRAYTDLLSEAMGLDERARDRLRWAALLHDIGKLRVEPSLLNKPAKPSRDEWETLQSHPRQGYELAAGLLPWLGEWGRAIVEHHERFDGRGYPHGLTGEEISLAGRMIAVVDSFETMTAARAYKKPMNHAQARRELARCAGTQFDATVVRTFLSISLPRVIWAMGPLSALIQLPYVNSLQFAGTRALSLTGSAAGTAVSAPVLAAGLTAAVTTPAGATAVAAHAHHAPVTSGSAAARAAAPARAGDAAAVRPTTPRHATAHAGAGAATSTISRRAHPAHPAHPASAAAVASPHAPAAAPAHPVHHPSPATGSGTTSPASPTSTPPAATTANPNPSAPSHGHPTHPAKPPKPPKPAPPPKAGPPAHPTHPAKPPKPPKPAPPPKAGHLTPPPPANPPAPHHGPKDHARVA